MVKYWGFAAGEFEDEEVFYIIERLAKHEGRDRTDVEKEWKKKVEYRTNHENKAHPYEAWGPQELADRINSCPSAEDLGVL